MNKKNIEQILINKKYDIKEISVFVNYLADLEQKKKKDRRTNNWVSANSWLKIVSDEKLTGYFEKVKEQGLLIDGVHTTINSRGVSLDYQAYKNKMLLAYPETKLDIGVVYKGDTFESRNDNGNITYTHILANPFENDNNKIIGAFAVIKNNRGSFLTTLSREEIEKHKRKAMTSEIWNEWYKEMVLKTVIKKAVKYHFDDEFEEINNSIDNDTDPEQTIDEKKSKDLQIATEKISKATDVKELIKIHSEYQNKGLGKKFLERLGEKKKEILESNRKENEKET